MKKWIIIYLAIMLIGLIFWSCSDDDNTTEPTNKAPTCTITLPADSATFIIGNNITVIADATDTDGTIAEVRFYFDDVQKDSVQSSPYSYILSTISLVEGIHTIKATAIDNDGAETSTQINIILAINSPSTPTLLTPTNGSTVTDLTPIFDWSDVTGATSYTLLVDNNSTFASPEINQSPTASTFTQVTNLTTGTYYWKVLATNSAGSSSYTSTWTVIVLTPPATPLLVSPTNGSTIEDLTPTFDWSDATDATSYTILADNNSTFASPEINQSPTTSTFTQVTSLAAGTYYWKVLATNAAGSSSYSTVWTVIVQAPRPPAPTLLSPVNGSTTSDQTPSFDWNDVSGATSYTILVDSNSDYSSPEINQSPSTSTYTAGTELAIGTYYWKVLATNAVGSGSYSSSWTVIISTPLPPTLLSPVNASTISDLTPTFDWSNVTGATSYTILVDNSSTFATPEINQSPSSSTYTPDSNLTAGTYYWKVLATNSAGSSAYTTARSVTISTSNPSSFVYVQGGTFQMGDRLNEGNSDELPLHIVALSNFYIGKYEVTQEEWSDIMVSNPSVSYGVGDNYPVYNVSWYAIMKYCNLRSMAEGLTPCYTISSSTDPANWGTVPTSSSPTWDAICNWSANGYRLPTEAEWEYSARGGILNADNYRYSGSDIINDVAWYSSNSGSISHTVGAKTANHLGLYDMSGNVQEWCWDWYGYTYYQTCSDQGTVINPKGPDWSSYRVARGGNWYYNADNCRVAYRNNYGWNPSDTNYTLGFRLARTP